MHAILHDVIVLLLIESAQGLQCDNYAKSYNILHVI